MKRYNNKFFNCTLPNGQERNYICWTENTRYGFRHLCKRLRTEGKYTTKACYYNRTWERFCYETVLEKAIDMLPKDEQGYTRAVLIDGTAEKIRQETESFLSAFKSEYDKLSPNMKQALSKTTIQNEEQAKTTLTVMKMANILSGK